MNSVFQKLYHGLIFIQSALFFIFIVENINDLDSIHFSFKLNNIPLDFTINLYSLIAVMGVIFTLFILSGLNIFGVGLNEESTKNVGRYGSLLVLFVMLSLTTSYYVLPLGWVGVFIDIFIVVIYFMYAVESFTGQHEEN